jgi:hypothetical protein
MAFVLVDKNFGSCTEIVFTVHFMLCVHNGAFSRCNLSGSRDCAREMKPRPLCSTDIAFVLLHHMYSVAQTPFDATSKSEALNYVASAFDRVTAKARGFSLQSVFGL